MTKKRVIRAWLRLRAATIDHPSNGYQPWGWDERTVAIVYPGFLEARARLRRMFEDATE